jgi:hypothetical protein
MTKPLISLQDLRRRIYAKAKSEPSWRFWGLYVHVCKEETLHEAYCLAKKNGGAPGVDGVTFEAIEESGVGGFIRQIRDELVSRKYAPMPNRKKEIPKDGGKKVRVLGIPSLPPCARERAPRELCSGRSRSRSRRPTATTPMRVGPRPGPEDDEMDEGSPQMASLTTYRGVDYRCTIERRSRASKSWSGDSEKGPRLTPLQAK